MRELFTLTFILQALTSFGQWDPAGGKAGSRAIHRDDAGIISWADSGWVQRGWYDISDKDSGVVEGGSVTNVYGNADNSTLSLGDSGVVTLYFSDPIKNIDGYDFAVFENGFEWFSGYFLEMAFVEVSTDGIHFVRFPAETNADTTNQYTNNAAMDPTAYHNLAGKHQAPYGTPFDLEELADSTGIDVDSIHYIRLVDVVGSINALYASRDANGRIINDPWPTAFGIGGFDLDAVGVLRQGVSGTRDNHNPKMVLYPNPVSTGSWLKLNGSLDNYRSIRILELASGREVLSISNGPFQWMPERPGFYMAEIISNDQTIIQKICVTD